MAKKIRFALEMDNGVEVRSLEELKNNFSLARVVGYLEDGKLMIWLRDRYADEIADEVEQLNSDDEELERKICEIFDVSYDEKELEKEIGRLERRKRLKQITGEKKYLDVIDKVAFDQDELYDLLDDEADIIYLCGERFSIPLSKSGVSYIGINTPVVVIDSKVEVDWEERKIVLESVIFDEKYQKIVQETSIEERTEINSNVKDSIDNIDIVMDGILFTMKTGKKILIQEKVQKLIDQSDKYAVFGKYGNDPWYSGERGIVVVSLATFEIIFNGNPQGEFGNYEGLKINNDWLVWSEVSFDIQTGRKCLLKHDSLSNSNINGFTIANQKIIYVIGEYASKSPISGWAYNFYTCDFEWKNAKKILSYSGADGLYIYDDLKFINGKIYFSYKVGHRYCPPKYTAFFDLATEEQNSILNVRKEYLS